MPRRSQKQIIEDTLNEKDIVSLLEGYDIAIKEIEKTTSKDDFSIWTLNRIILRKLGQNIEELAGELQETKNELESVKEALRMHTYKDDPRWEYENT